MTADAPPPEASTAARIHVRQLSIPRFPTAVHWIAATSLSTLALPLPQLGRKNKPYAAHRGYYCRLLPAAVWWENRNRSDDDDNVEREDDDDDHDVDADHGCGEQLQQSNTPLPEKTRGVSLYHTPTTTSDVYLEGRSKINSAAAAEAPEAVQAATIAKETAKQVNL